jgi:hypothetical protein
MRWVGHVALKVQMRNAHKILFGKRPCGRIMRRWENNIGMDLRGIGWGVVDWMHMAENRDQ